MLLIDTTFKILNLYYFLNGRQLNDSSYQTRLESSVGPKFAKVRYITLRRKGINLLLYVAVKVRILYNTSSRCVTS